MPLSLARTPLVRALFCALLVLAAPGARAQGFVGVYIWGGTLQQGSSGVDRLAGSVALSLASGFDTVRIAIGPNVVTDYGLSPDPCAGKPSLGCYATAMLAPAIWSDRRLKRVIVTAIDVSCFSYKGGNGNGCLVADQLNANASAIQAEYQGLFTALRQRFGDRLSIVLDNWEGDNFAYCGDSWSYANNIGGFTAACRATWPTGQTNGARVAAFLQWTSLKDRAAALFMRSHPLFSVVVAPEFNTYTAFATACPTSKVCNAATDSVLDAIAASGGRSWCSWSSWDAEGAPNGAYLLAAKTILNSCRNLIVGEGGYDQNIYSAAQTAALFTAMDQIRRLPGVAGVVPWHGFDRPNPPTRYGLWTANGTPQVINLLGPLRPRPTP